MIRLCVMGNSHMAAIKLGWDALQRAGDPLCGQIAPTFFGAPREGMKRLALKDGCLVPTRKDIAEGFQRMAGGQDRIRLADYDAFLLVGLSVSIKRILRFYKTHVWFGLAPDQGRTMVSRAFVRDFLTERYGDTLLVETAALLRGACTQPVLALAEPFWAAWVRRMQDDGADYGWDRVVTAGDGAAIGDLFRLTVGAALAPHAIFVPQPRQTIEDGILTREIYNKEASRLITGEGGGTDAAHMNGDFGREIWPEVMRALAGGAGEKAA